MAINTANYSISQMLVLGLLVMASLDFTVAQIGVCYGRNGEGLPPPSRVVALYKQYGIQRMRIYEPHQPTLEALRGTNIELTIGVPNIKDLEYVAASQANANAWVQTNIKNYPNVRFRHIVVGNEVSPAKGDASQYVQFVLPAMRNVYNAISAAGLRDRIKVSTSVSTRVIDDSKTYPPNAGEFKPDVKPYLNPIIRFLVSTGAPIFVSIYPYFAYLNNQGTINLQYALLQPNSGVVVPGGCTNLFCAIYDNFYAALERSVVSSLAMTDASGSVPEPKPGESGWSGPGGPTAASVDQAASAENERIYINNLIQVVKNGTPKKPGPIETYIFAMFDENQKPGNEDEKHFGIFRSDGQPKFPINFN